MKKWCFVAFASFLFVFCCKSEANYYEINWDGDLDNRFTPAFEDPFMPGMGMPAYSEVMLVSSDGYYSCMQAPMLTASFVSDKSFVVTFSAPENTFISIKKPNNMDSYQFALSLDTKNPLAASRPSVNGSCSYEYTESNNPTPLYSEVVAAKGIDGSYNPFLLTYLYQTFNQDLRFKSLTLYGTLPNDFVGVYSDIVPSLRISVSGQLTTDVNPGNWVYLESTAVACDINLDMNFSGPATVNFSVFDDNDSVLSQQTNPVNFVNGSGGSVLVLSQAEDAAYITAQWMHGSGTADVVTEGSARSAEIDLNLCTTGDLDLNGTVDISDFVIFAGNWLK